MELLEQIKELYEKVEDKKDFHLAVAEEFELQYSSIRTNWFGSRFEIPTKYGIMKRLVKFTKDYLEKQPTKEVA